MYRVVGFHGYVGAGKNEAARAIESTHVPIAFADKMREGLFALNPIIGVSFSDGRDIVFLRLQEYVKKVGWDEAKKNPEVRRLMQSFGTEAGRDIHGYECWCVVTLKTVRPILAQGKNVAFTDCRFREEGDLIHNLGGIVLQITKPHNGPVNDHSSEQQKIKVDGVILNNGTITELHQRVRDFVQC